MADTPQALLPESTVRVSTFLHRLPCQRCIDRDTGVIQGYLEADGNERTLPPLHKEREYRVICTNCKTGAFVAKKYPYVTYEPLPDVTEAATLPAPIGEVIDEQ